MVRPGYSAGKLCPKCIRLLADTRLANANLPKRADETWPTFANFVITTPSQGGAYAACRHLVECLHEDATCGILLIGPSSIGKSHLAAATLHQAILNGSTGRFVSFSALLSEIQASYREDSDRSAEEIVLSYGGGRIAGVPSYAWLALDDVGSKPVTIHAADVLCRLLDERLARRLPTILTTNYTGAELAQRMAGSLSKPTCDDATIARILERIAELCRPYVMDGPSWRTRGRSG